MRITKRNDKRYPYEIELHGRRILIPQQKQFGTYCRIHGCSVTACSIALQEIGKMQADKSVWNPQEIANKAKKEIQGYNGSKLSIWGCKTILNKIAGKEVAFWHSNDGKHDAAIRSAINAALKAGHVVLYEEKNPIHTVIILELDEKGRWVIATNGKIVRRSQVTETRKGLHGMRGANNQKNWWNGKAHGAGYVIVKG